MGSVPIIQKTNRIAVCLSGQIRSWRKCYHTWNLIWQYLANPQVDFFIHTWDENSYPAKFGGEKETTKVEQSEIDEIVNLLKPKKILFEKSRKFFVIF